MNGQELWQGECWEPLLQWDLPDAPLEQGWLLRCYCWYRDGLVAVVDADVLVTVG
jgi:hypothetical protein